MPATIPDKANVAGSTLDAVTEFNPLKNDLYTQITSSDQTPTGGINDQWGKSSSNFVHWANFSTDGGAADAYVLSVQSPTIAPTKYKTGMEVRFRATNNNTGVSTVNAYALGVKKIFKQDGTTVLKANDINTGVDTRLRYDESLDAAAGAFVLIEYGKVVQVVNTQTGAVATGSTVIPVDDTIPQITEGDEYMTLAIVPTNINNILLIEVVIFFANAAAGSKTLCAALFQDAVANALAVSAESTTFVEVQDKSFSHNMVAGTISSTIFRVRAGGDLAGTTTFNGAASGRLYGGVLASSITITEIQA